MVPADAGLRARWVDGAEIDDRQLRSAGGSAGHERCARRFGCRHAPAAVRQRKPAWREPRRPDQVDCIGPALVCEPGRADRQEVVVDDVQQIARGEAVGRVEDVGLAPADELLAGLERETAPAERRAQAADAERRAPQPAVGAVEPPLRFHSIVGGRPRVERSGERQPRRRRPERFLANQRLADQLAVVDGGRPEVDEAGPFDEAALAEGLGGGRQRRQQREHAGQPGHGSRRSACSVKSCSFIGRLYCQFLEPEHRPALPPEVGHLQRPACPDSLDILDVAVVEHPHDLGPDEALDLLIGVVVLPDPDARLRVLRALPPARGRVDPPAGGSVQRLLAVHREVGTGRRRVPRDPRN